MGTVGTIAIPAKRVSAEIMKPIITRESVILKCNDNYDYLEAYLVLSLLVSSPLILWES